MTESTAAAPSKTDQQLQKQLHHHQHQAQEHFSLRTWIRQQPWKQHFKEGCKLIVKSPLNFFIFFCCLSVVVWGAFLVLLLGNMVKLGTDAKQKLWIEIASQVLNGFFTLANVPVHPKRFLGFVRGCRIWSEDKAIKKQFLDTFLSKYQADGGDVPNLKTTQKERAKELLDRLAFYRCFPDYGKERLADSTALEEVEAFAMPSDDKTGQVSTAMTAAATVGRARAASRADATVVVSRSRSRSKTLSQPSESSVGRSTSHSKSRSRDSHDSLRNSFSPLHPTVVVDMEPRPSTDDQKQPLSPETNGPSSTSSTDDSVPQEGGVQVNIAEEDLNELMAEETQRVVQSIVLPFLPFPLDMPSFSADASNVAEAGGVTTTTVGKQHIPLAPIVTKRTPGSLAFQGPASASLSSPSRNRPTLERGTSQANLSRASTKRMTPRTRARTMTMSMARELNASESSQWSTFMIREDHPLSAGSTSASTRSHFDTTVSSIPSNGQDQPSQQSSSPPPTFEVSKSKMSKDAEPKNAPIPMPAPLTKEQMQWVDQRQSKLLGRQGKLQRGWPWYNYTIPSGIEPVDFFADDQNQSPRLKELSTMSPILLSSSPSELVINPSRFLVIVGSFNLNSMIQEILCGFMWGMNYHVRPGWVTGVGMAFGCMAAIIPSVMIMLHEQAMSKIRVVATAEEAIQDALDGTEDTKL